MYNYSLCIKDSPHTPPTLHKKDIIITKHAGDTPMGQFYVHVRCILDCRNHRSWLHPLYIHVLMQYENSKGNLYHIIMYAMYLLSS